MLYLCGPRRGPRSPRRSFLSSRGGRLSRCSPATVLTPVRDTLIARANPAAINRVVLSCVLMTSSLRSGMDSSLESLRRIRTRGARIGGAYRMPWARREGRRTPITCCSASCSPAACGAWPHTGSSCVGDLHTDSCTPTSSGRGPASLPPPQARVDSTTAPRFRKLP